MLEGKDRAQCFVFSFCVRVLRCLIPTSVPVLLLRQCLCAFCCSCPAKVAEAREGIKALKRKETELCPLLGHEAELWETTGLQVSVFGITVCLLFLYRVSIFPLVSGGPGLSLLSLWNGHN